MQAAFEEVLQFEKIRDHHAGDHGTEWPEGDLGFLTKTTSDAQDTLGWVSAQNWSNGKVGLHD